MRAVTGRSIAGFCAAGAVCLALGCSTSNKMSPIQPGTTTPPPAGVLGAGMGGGTTPTTTGSTAGASAPTGSGGSRSGGAGMSAAAGTGTGAAGMGNAAGAMAQAGTGAAGSTGGSGSAAGAGGSSGSTCNKDLTAMPGQDDCTAPLKPGDDRDCKFQFNGKMEHFLIYATPNYDPCTPATMIMDMHGLSETAEVQAGKAGFNLLGMMYPNGYGSSWRMAVQKDNAIVVTPQGTDATGSPSWDPTADVAYVNKAADMVEAIANIDKDKEYVTGISMGGGMTIAVGCDNAMRWHAMSPVAMLMQGCPGLARPTPVISFHAPTDMLTNYSADQTLMGQIAGYNHCKTGPTDFVKYGGSGGSSDPVCFVTPNGVGDPDAKDPLHIPLQPCPSSVQQTSCVKWSDCDEGVEVIFCTVPGSTQPLGGHILYNNDSQLDLSEVAWPFFKKFWK